MPGQPLAQSSPTDINPQHEHETVDVARYRLSHMHMLRLEAGRPGLFDKLTVGRLMLLRNRISTRTRSTVTA
jgi:hypothetical protein